VTPFREFITVKLPSGRTDTFRKYAGVWGGG
jgi:hypothetical protein